jgi:DNA-directed RNA polymerase subunit L
MAPHFAGLVVSGQKARFEIVDVDLCIVNSVRRAIMADVPTAAFKFDPTRQGEGVIILRNTSTLHNEFIGHRVSLVPLGLDENQMRSFDPTHFKCILKVKNAGSDSLPVTTADFEVFNQAGVRLPKAVRDALFPPCPITGGHILLLRLKPSSVCDGNGEEVHIECVACLGTGRQHARWSPVSQCFFRNKSDSSAVAVSLASKIGGVETQRKADGRTPLDASEIAAIAAQHATLDAHRCFVKDEYGDPSAFEFLLECESALRPTYLVFRALQVLHDKLLAIGEALTSRDADKISVESFPNMDDFYMLTVRGEDHTIGNLLQGMLYKRWIRDGLGKEVAYIGYYQPHPLENHIVIKVKSSVPGDDIRVRMTEGVVWLAAHLDTLIVEWIGFSALDMNGIVAVNELLLRKGRKAIALKARAR